MNECDIFFLEGGEGESKHTLTSDPPTYFQGIETPTSQDLLCCLQLACSW